MPKKLLKHGKFYQKDGKGNLIVYRAGSIVDVTENQAKNNKDQFVDLPVDASKDVSKGEIVKEAKVYEVPTPAKKAGV